jgi:archaellum biogenesis ATPase FlaH
LDEEDTAMNFKEVPTQMKSLDRWVCWRLINGRKIPVMLDGRPASSTDPKTWKRFDDVCESGEKIGFVFLDCDGLIGIDLDGCRDKQTQKIEKWALEVIVRFGTYAEVSPSGTGVKLFGKTDKKWVHRKKKSFGGEHTGIEVYQHGRFFCVTGDSVDPTLREVVDVTEKLDWLATKFDMKEPEPAWKQYERKSTSSSVIERASAYVSKCNPSVSGSNGHLSAIKVAHILVNGFSLERQDALAVFSEFNARCQPPWSDRECEHKIDSALKFQCERGWLASVEASQWATFAIPAIQAKPKNNTNEQEKKPSAVRVKTIKQATNEVVENIGNARHDLMSLGIPRLDYALEGGVDKGELVLIGARPSHGKSAIAMQMAHHMTQYFPVGIVSQEMSALALGKRTLQFVSSVPKVKWEQEKHKLQEDVAKHFKDREEGFILEGVRNILELCEQAIALQQKEGIKTLFVDYAQIVEGVGRSTYERVSDVSVRLRKLASETGLVLVTLAQLSRDVEKRNDFIPVCRDLKDSGQLEQDADVIMFGVWPYKISQDEKTDKNKYQFFIAKNRNRSIVEHGFDVYFEPSRQMYLPADTEEQVTPQVFNGDF